MFKNTVRIALAHAELEGFLDIPQGASGIVIFSHGSGSGRLSPRNQFVARVLGEKGLATLLFDLMTPQEDQDYARRFDIPFLSERLLAVTQWVKKNTQNLKLGYFGASTGAASALIAAASLGEDVFAVVSRGGRPDLVDAKTLARVQAPTLFLVGGWDTQVIELNRLAFAHLGAEKEMVIIPEAGHLFEEPGKLEEAARLAAQWFLRHLA